jgi:hypothetical protein
MIEWKVSMSRVTLFPASPASFSPVSGLQLFHDVWGVDPDNFQKQGNPLAPSFAQGRRGGLMVGCSVHPSRIDFNFGPALPPIQGSSTIAVQLIQNARQLRRGLLEVFDALGRDSVAGAVARVAMTIQVLAVSPDFAGANNAIMGVIPAHYGLRLGDEEDVLFQVNVPYVSQTASRARMNAVTKWGGARLQVMTFTLPAGGSITSSTGAISEGPQKRDFIAASVSFEINSVPLEAQISSADQALLFREGLGWVEQRQLELGLIVEGLRNV